MAPDLPEPCARRWPATLSRAVSCSCLVLLLPACERDVNEDLTQAARPVRIMEFGGQAAVTKIEYPGAIAATQSSEMAFEVEGRIIEFPAGEGQRVVEGEVLARLDPRDYQSSLNRAQANANAARADFARFKQAFEENAVTPQDLDLARRNMEVAAAELEKAQKALDDTVLRAPFAGTMARKLVPDFANVRAKEPVLIVQDDSSLEIRAAVPERDWSRVRPGSTVEQLNDRLQPEVGIASFPDRRFPARLTEVTTDADPVTRTFQVTLRFDNPPDIAIQPGMTGRVIITLLITADQTGTLIPAAATLSDEEGNAMVWRIDPETMTVSRVPVTLGSMAGDGVIVLSGLETGDLIAVSGVHQLREGMLVRRFGD